MRAWRIAALGALAAGAGFLAGAAPGGAGAPRFGLEGCRRVAVTTPGGRALRGVEDLARAPDGGALILSAYDRRAPEAAPSGLFLVDLAALSGLRAPATPLAAAPTRPHGIAAAADGRIAVIARDGAGGAAILTGALRGETLALGGRIAGEGLCRANDLAWAGERLLATLDRRDCGVALADLAPWARTGRLVAAGPDGAVAPVRDGLAFPNGVAALPGGAALAETRRHRVLLPDGRAVATPGAPDNLTVADDGGVIAALHPSVFALWLALSGAPARPGSRVVRIDPETGAVALLYDDPDGAVLSAATTALLVGERLIAGSVLDEGLLVCEGG